MTATIRKCAGEEAYSLIYADHIASMPDTHRQSMHEFFTRSTDVWMGSDGDIALGIWGLIPPTILSDRAYLWLYHTEAVAVHSFMFIRHSQRAVEEMLKVYPLIVGHTEVGAIRSIRWLRWLGAEFGQTTDDKLIPFTIKAKPHG